MYKWQKREYTETQARQRSVYVLGHLKYCRNLLLETIHGC
jgi:hypothetical protein